MSNALWELLLKSLRDPIAVGRDERGIPVVDYGSRFGERIGRAYNPLIVALHGVAHFGLDQFGIGKVAFSEQDTWREIVAMADWLVDSETGCDRCATWTYNFPWPSYGLSPPWKSALAEICGALFLFKMFEVTRETKYRCSASMHLDSLLTPPREGGLLIVDQETRGWWFPEYYAPKKRIPYVLNGMLTVLLGLRYASAVLSADRYQIAFENGMVDLRRRIGSFDGGFFTYYDSFGNPADSKYHKIHVELLSLLTEATADAYLRSVKERWKRMGRGYVAKEPCIFLVCLARSGRIPFSRPS